MTNGVLECFRCHTPIPENSRFCLSCGADVSGGDGPTSTSSSDVVQERLRRVLEGKYRIERLLGKGGMGAVFLAHDLTLERAVAIKVLLPPDVAQDEQLVRRFQQEAKTAAKLDHPNIIPIYRVESEGGLNYFVMKYISGSSLEDVLEKHQPLSVPDIQRILWEAACALGHAHQRGVVHRDVKPANIMFDHEGRVMLTDFGISKALQAATGFTATGMIIGTPHYMAPEQGKGAPVDGRADQYSLGVVGYRMITGELPFGGDSVHTIIYKHIYEEPPLVNTKRPGTPGSLSAAIARSLSKEPELRFPSMEDFATGVWPEQPVASPTKGRAASPSRSRLKTTADAPTEITGRPPPASPPPAHHSLVWGKSAAGTAVSSSRCNRARGPCRRRRGIRPVEARTERGAGSGSLREPPCSIGRYGSDSGYRASPGPGDRAVEPAHGTGQAAPGNARGGRSRLSHDRVRPFRSGVHRRRRRRADPGGRVPRQARPSHDPDRARRVQDSGRNGAGGREQHGSQALHAASRVSRPSRRLDALAVLAALAMPAVADAQGVQNATLRRAQQAYDNLEYRQVLSLAQGALRERLTGVERARAYELLGFSYAALDSILKAVDAFKQVVLLDPERQLDANRVSPKAYSAFDVALRQVLLVRQLRVDSSSFVGGRGGVPIRFTVTQPGRVVTRAIGGSGAGSFLVDSGAWSGQVNLSWPARMPNGDPVPAGTYTVVVDARLGQNTFSASQPVRVSHGTVDTLPFLMSLPGYQYLPETEVPPQSWRPLGLAFLYTGGALVGTVGLESSTLGSSSKRELAVVGGATLVTGLVMTLRKPAPRPAAANILYNRLLRDQIARRNQDIAKENVTRRQQVQITLVPLPKPGTGGTR